MKRSGCSGPFIAFLIMVGCILAGYRWLSTQASPHWNAQRSWQRIEKTVDPSALQTWATNLLHEYSHITNFDGYHSVRGPLPTGLDKIWKHRPSVILRDGRDGGERYVCVAWGSAMLGRWGLVVGSPTFRWVPGVETTDPPQFWKPGIYFYEYYH